MGKRKCKRQHSRPQNQVKKTEEAKLIEDSNILETKWNADDPKEVIDEKLVTLFLSVTNFKTHHEAQSMFTLQYFAILYTLIKDNVVLNENAKMLVLAVAWARKDHKLAGALLQIPGEIFGIKEVLRAVTLLDTKREYNAKCKLLKHLEEQGCKKKKKLNQIKSTIGSLKAETPFIGSLNSSIIRQVKLWSKNIPVERLEFFALYFPTDAWKKLADLCHLHPEKDFPQSPWFLPFCFGKELPSHLKLSEINENTVSQIVCKSKLDYCIVRKYKDGLTEEAKLKIVEYSDLDTVLWYYDELKCNKVNNLITNRLQKGEHITLSYGKLMEKIIYLKFECKEKVPFMKNLMSYAEEKLKEISFNLASPVSVIGDMSGSMDIAIRTSNIVASLLTAITNAELVFFDSENVIPPFIPKTVDQVLQLCSLIKSRGSTVPAVSLHPYYEEKKIFKTFFVITDEEENGKYKGWSFATWFKKYYDEVYKSRIVFITFQEDISYAHMVSELKSLAPEIEVLRFCFHKKKPDLSKLDHVFGMLSCRGAEFNRKLSNYENLIKKGNLSGLLEYHAD